MPKLKTKKAFAKRIKITKNKKMKRGKTGTGHLLGTKTRKRKRVLRRGAAVSSAEKKKIKKALPYSF